MSETEFGIGTKSVFGTKVTNTGLRVSKTRSHNDGGLGDSSDNALSNAPNLGSRSNFIWIESGNCFFPHDWYNGTAGRKQRQAVHSYTTCGLMGETSRAGVGV